MYLSVAKVSKGSTNAYLYLLFNIGFPSLVTGVTKRLTMLTRTKICMIYISYCKDTLINWKKVCFAFRSFNIFLLVHFILQGSEDNECGRHDDQMPESTNSNTVAMTTLRTAPSSPCSVLQS